MFKFLKRRNQLPIYVDGSLRDDSLKMVKVFLSCVTDKQVVVANKMFRLYRDKHTDINNHYLLGLFQEANAANKRCPTF